ncbi:hypothetical protein BpHYR1_038399 [Brachionus plicatilis]|uniref:Uncharacterized protein n=1 Tax=Brachionus plicatilis TaxID=10195 RepID=A0A3M7S3R6_BRAPC|nr:hypothetical protein BpHYR1_038399 [Brachionus plicatilis]
MKLSEPNVVTFCGIKNVFLYEISQCRLIGAIYNFCNANANIKYNKTFLAFSFANANRLILEIQPAEFSCSTSSVDPTIPSKS